MNVISPYLQFSKETQQDFVQLLAILTFFFIHE